MFGKYIFKKIPQDIDFYFLYAIILNVEKKTSVTADDLTGLEFFASSGKHYSKTPHLVYHLFDRL